MKEFNIVIIGVGGQGILSLTKLIEECALLENNDVKGMEQHGLAQRGGSIKCHIKFGKDLYSPLVMEGKADLIISTELLEALRSLNYANSNTTIVINKEKIIPVSSYLSGREYPSENEIINSIKLFTKNVYLVDGSNIVRKASGEAFYTNTFILGYLIARNLIPIKKETGLKVVKENFKDKFLEENLKVFELAFRE